MRRTASYLFFSLVPIFCFYFGLSLNNVALVLNNNQMPVYVPGGCEAGVLDKDDPKAKEDEDAKAVAPGWLGWPLRHGKDDIHTCMVKETRAKWLCDWIYYHEGPTKYWMSPGDLFLFFSDWANDKFLYMLIMLILVDLRIVRPYHPEMGPTWPTKY